MNKLELGTIRKRREHSHDEVNINKKSVQLQVQGNTTHNTPNKSAIGPTMLTILCLVDLVDTLCLINTVVTRRGMPTVFKQVNHLGNGYSHPGQLSLAIPPWVGAMSTSESWGTDRHTARCIIAPSSTVN